MNTPIKLAPMRFVGFLPGAMITQLVKDMRAAGYDVTKDRETFVARMDGQDVARALRHPSGKWITRANPDVVAVGPSKE